ncbi:putative MFS family arabinose efflux permease [Tumebacillus sp. BK434]|uniref:MFS transporter n=1 Tax=Tumebacillus sp. BK434 TaxID=2512169 RepID=UPI00104927D0|nr:MFS transporter [Tumebacillus sp. BK434]TCP58107.1 putative MFS family arabinose efflux permease [Tumebacillus sp. BK434]
MFANRYVRTVVLSRVLLQLGIWIRNFAILLYITDVTQNDAFYVSMISVVEYAPIFLFAIIAGTFADRWQPKRTMVWSDLLSAVSVAVVLLVLQQGVWLALLLGTFVSASLSQFSQPSATKLFKMNVPAEQLQGVMAMFQSLIAIFMVIGPVIGTFLYLEYGIETSLLLTCLLFVGSGVILMFLPRDVEERQGQARAGFLAEMAEGIRYIGRNRALRALGATFSVSGLAAGLITPLLLFVTMEKLGQDKQFLQWLMMANGAAMLVGGALIMTFARKVKPQALLMTGLLVSAVCTIGAGTSTLLPLSFALQIIGGLVYPCIQVGIQTLLMQNTEAAMMGRVGGAITPIFMGMMVLGMSFAGYLKDLISLEAVYAISASLLVIGAMLLVPLLQARPTE